MKEYLVEAVLGVVLVVVFIAVSVWQSATTLSQEEVDHYIGILEERLPRDLEDRAKFISRLRTWAENDDGAPVYMLNLMRFYSRPKDITGGPTGGTSEEANAHYEDTVVPLLLERGGYPIVGGATTRIGDGEMPDSNLMVYQRALDNWDHVLVVRYPGRRTFLDLMADPDYVEVMPYKLASLMVVLTPVSGELVIPDLRWIVGGGALVIFSMVGWIRAAQRSSRYKRSAQGTS